MRTTISVLVASIGAAGACMPAAGDTIMSNIAFTDDDGGTLFGPNSNTIYKAYGWTMPGQAYFLEGVTLRMFDYAMSEARVSIWEGESIPETEVAVLESPVEPGLEDWFDITFTPSGSFTFEADTTYWVYVESLGGGNGFLWGDTTPPTAPSGIGENVGYIFNDNPSGFMNSLAVTGKPVPAPAAPVLIGAAGLAACARRRR